MHIYIQYISMHTCTCTSIYTYTNTISPTTTHYIIYVNTYLYFLWTHTWTTRATIGTESNLHNYYTLYDAHNVKVAQQYVWWKCPVKMSRQPHIMALCQFLCQGFIPCVLHCLHHCLPSAREVASSILRGQPFFHQLQHTISLIWSIFLNPIQDGWLYT